MLFDALPVPAPHDVLVVPVAPPPGSDAEEAMTQRLRADGLDTSWRPKKHQGQSTHCRADLQARTSFATLWRDDGVLISPFGIAEKTTSLHPAFSLPPKEKIITTTRLTVWPLNI